MCISGLRAKFTAYHYYLLSPHTKLGQGYCDDSGVRTHSYDCSPHTKYVKRFIYVYSGSGMSMKWMRGPLWCGVASYGHQPHIKYENHLLCV